LSWVCPPAIESRGALRRHIRCQRVLPGAAADLLIRLAQTSLVQARWTERILDECFYNLMKDRPDLEPARLRRTRALVNEAVRDCLVTGYEPLIEGLSLPDADDRHVLAAAIRAGAQAIVTFNLNHFPATTVRSYGMEALHPDRFVLGLIDLNEATVLRVVGEQEAALRRTETRDIMTRLELQGLPKAVAVLRQLCRAP
jgi:hypothetical protein